MRKILIKLAFLIAFLVAISILWIFGGRHFSLFLDRFGTIESVAISVSSLAYEGGGTGGILRLNDLALNLSPPSQDNLPPNIGTTKDGQLALSFRGKVFPFGPLRAGTDNLAIDKPAGDEASICIRHSALSWPTLFDFNFMTGRSPSWKRYLYSRLSWKKQSGASLEMLWRYEQYFYPSDGWTTAMMTREGSTGLVRVDIQN